MTPPDELRDELLTNIAAARELREEYEPSWDDAINLASGRHHLVFPIRDGWTDCYVTADKIGEAIGSHLAVVTQEIPEPEFRPSEIGEPPIVFLTENGAVKAGNAGLIDDEDQLGGEAPIDQDEYENLLENGFEDSDFVLVNEQLSAEALTQEIKGQFRRGATAEVFQSAVNESLVLGHCDVAFQWDENDQVGKIVQLYPYLCWIDQKCNGIDTAEWFALLEIMPVHVAKEKFPDREEVIDKQRGTWSNFITGYTRTNRHERYDNVTNRQDYVGLWTYWKHNHYVPMTPEQAIASGRVEAVSPDGVEQGEVVYRIADTGELTGVDEKNWPKRKTVLQAHFVGNESTAIASNNRRRAEMEPLESYESDYSDIPIGRFGYFPIVHSPYYYGIPMRLYGLQRIRNEIVTILQDHMLRYSAPSGVVPESTWVEHRDSLEKLFSQAGLLLPVRDRIFQETNGQPVQMINPPQPSGILISLLQNVDAAMDRMVGNVDALRGEYKSETSGELFSRANEVARGPISTHARATMNAMRRLYRTWAEATIKYLPAEEWAARNRKYPPAILEAMRQRLQRMDFDIKVNVGGATLKETRFNQISQLLQVMPELRSDADLTEQVLELLEVPRGKEIAARLRQRMEEQAAAQNPAPMLDGV